MQVSGRPHENATVEFQDSLTLEFCLKKRSFWSPKMPFLCGPKAETIFKKKLNTINDNYIVRLESDVGFPFAFLKAIYIYIETHTCSKVQK